MIKKAIIIRDANINQFEYTMTTSKNLKKAVKQNTINKFTNTIKKFNINIIN